MREPTGPEHDAVGAGRPGESEAVSRKKVLLRLLAAREAGRLGLAPAAGADDVQLARWRQQAGLHGDEELREWLSAGGLSRDDLQRFGWELALVELLERHFDAEITAGLPLQRRAQAALSAAWEDRWVQLDVRLGPARAAAAPAVFEALWPLADPARRRGLELFFAVRKPPDLRLRLRGMRPLELVEDWGHCLRELQRAGLVAHWSQVPYEPEAARFGGAGVMEAAHRWFETDSLAWLRWEPLAARQGCRLAREVLSLAVLNGLFGAVVDDGAEAWDVWRRLAELHGLTPEPGKPVHAVTPAGLREAASPAEAELLAAYESAGDELAAGLSELAQRGELRRGRRSLLADLALFHWNRFGLSVESRARLVTAMLAVLEPRAPGPES